MSSDKDLYWELKNGGTEKGDKESAPEGGDYLPRKRLRSSGSYTGDESVNSAETSPKKAKVQNDSSFELSEKVQNNHHDNNGDSEFENSSKKVKIDVDTSDIIKDVKSDNSTPKNLRSRDTDILSSKSEEFFRKSVKQQVQEVASDLDMQTRHIFVKPPGYTYNPSQHPEPGEYEVSLSLIGGEVSENFSGKGSTPYEAIRVAYKMAKEFLTNEKELCWSPKRKKEESSDAGNCTIGEEETQVVEGPVDATHVDMNAGNGETEEREEDFNGHESKDSEEDYGDSEGDEEQEPSNWVHSLENFWDKALASKYPTISVNYSDMDQQTNEHVVECSIGKLVVEGTGNTKVIARGKAAQFMFSMIETILENEGTDTLKKNIIEGEESEEASVSESNFTQPPFKDETAVETVDEEENYGDEDQEEIGEAASESHPDISPQKYPEPVGLAPYSPMQSGAEYCLALARVDRPQDKPMLLDIANMARRTRAGMATNLLSSLMEGENSDDEEQEGGRILDVMNQLLNMSSRLTDRTKQKMLELFNRSCLGQMRPSMTMSGVPGLLPGAGLGQQYHQLYQQQAAYPGIQPGYPGGTYPNQKARLLAGQVTSPPQPPPPKPVQPLKNLCQFPMPGAIEGVGSVTVTLEDYKTLQVGTFLNDVIIDFYMKYLQFTLLSEEDKNRVHIFTTFWFSRLTSKPSPIEARKDPVQRRYDRVKRWTRKVNIFEKDFVVVPINENYHWYLCIICYPGMVGCHDMKSNMSCSTPARQKNRRRAKDRIKALRGKMNAKPRKDESDERDEPLASEDEVEHEDDSVDLELWKRKVVEWEKMEVIRKEEERKRIVELERQRREWEERRREYEEQQRKLYEQQQRMYEEQQRYAFEKDEMGDDEEMGDEEENWEDEEKFDEDGNPIEEKNDAYGELISDKYDKFGEPLSYDDDAMEDSEEYCDKGGFVDAAKYRTSVDVEMIAEDETPVKARAMAADWDDWGEEDEQVAATEQQDISTDKDQEGKNHLSSSTIAHTAPLAHFTEISSTANLIYTPHVEIVKELCQGELDAEGNEEEVKYKSSMVSHAVSWTKDSKDSNNTAIIHKLTQDKLAQTTVHVDVIPQVDGIVDEGSDEEIEEKECNFKSDEQKEFVNEVNDNLEENGSKILCDEASNISDEMENDDSIGGAGESGMSTDEEIVLKQPGVVRYADIGDDSDTVNEDAEIESGGEEHASKVTCEEAEELAVVEESSVHDAIEKPETGEEGSKHVTSNTETEDNDESSGTEKYDEEEKRADADVHDRLSDSEIEEVEVAEKQSSEHEKENSEYSSGRSESESEAYESEDEAEDISNDVPVKQPCILVFDSLGGKKDRQARLFATLRDFLTKEFEEKYPGQTREFSTRTMPGAAPKVPQQPNLTDCGLFLCHNVETFFKNPVMDFTMPVTSLSSWFPDSESRMKRRDLAGIIRKLATQQNQDKLEQLQLPDLVFVEPERARPTPRYERANSPGSDGDNVEDYNSEDDYVDDDDEQRNSERYSSSPQDKRRVENRKRKETVSTEDDTEEDARSDKRSEGKGQKRYRSDDSGSDEERKSRHQKRRSDRDSSSGSCEEFDSPTVYGKRPVSLSSPMKRLPPGISISRTVEDNGSRFRQPNSTDNTFQGQADITRRLPPGISISRSSSSVPPRAPLPDPVLPPTSITMVRNTIVRDDTVEDPTKVTIEDVSDCSDDCEIFDLDEPAFKRTYSANIAQRPTNNSVKEQVADLLFQLPPGVSISRGESRSVEEVSESKFDEEWDEGNINDSFEDENECSMDDPIETSSNRYGDEFLPSMVVHQAFMGGVSNAAAKSMVTHQASVGAVFNTAAASMVTHQASAGGVCNVAAVSMVTHQMSKELYAEIIEHNIPQFDGGNDPESDDDRDKSESIEVNQEEYLQADTNEEICVETQSQEKSAETIEPVNNTGNSVEMPTDDIDDIDNQGLEEGVEIYAADSAVAENQEDLKSGEEFNNEEFYDGSNLQNAEEIELDAMHSEEVNFHDFPENLPTEESVDHIDEELEQGAEDVEDSVDLGESSYVLHATNPVMGDEDEDTIEGEDKVLDTSGEVINDGTDVDNTDLMEESTEVYNDADDNQEYGYEDCEEEDMYEEEDYSYEYSQPPVKRAKMSPEAEVVLDSDSEDDSQAPAQAVRTQVHQQNLFQNQLQLQHALLAQQQQRTGYQQPPPAQFQEYSQQYPHQLIQAAGPHNSRKRKLESQALCIKDGQVYLKPFSQLPPALLGETMSSSRPDNIPTLNKPNPSHTDLYKPLPIPVQPGVVVHQLSAHSYPRGGALEEQKVGGILQRIRQLPPGLVVQRKGVTEQRRGSVEEDDYQSDELEEIIDGQEADDDLDIINDQSSKDFYSEDEESSEEVIVHNREEQFEDENSKDSDGTDNEEVINGGRETGVDLVFEEADVDVQEACEIFDKEEVHLKRNLTIETNTLEGTETNEKLGEMIEGEEVVEGDDSQSGDVVQESALEAEIAE